MSKYVNPILKLFCFNVTTIYQIISLHTLLLTTGECLKFANGYIWNAGFPLLSTKPKSPLPHHYRYEEMKLMGDPPPPHTEFSVPNFSPNLSLFEMFWNNFKKLPAAHFYIDNPNCYKGKLLMSWHQDLEMQLSTDNSLACDVCVYVCARMCMHAVMFVFCWV